MRFLDKDGLALFWDNIAARLNKKADKTHSHAIADVTNLQSSLDGKADSSHGTHVSYSATDPIMDGVASAGSAGSVARSDHKHPTDTSRASKVELDEHDANTTKHITATERTNWNAAKTHADAAHAPSDAEKNQNAFSNVTVGSTTIVADTATDTLTLVAGDNVTITPDATNDKITISAIDTDTTYSAGTGISLSGTTFSNSGVRSVTSGSINGTISVNTNGSVVEVAVKGLGSAAYKATSAFDAAGEAGKALTDAKTYTDEVASGKADTEHSHDIEDVSGLQAALDGKAASSHGTHVSFDATNKPKMDGTAAFGTSSSVARADHVHPVDTSRASKADFDSHTGNTTVHITAAERTNWGAAYTHSQTTHARTDATKVADSTTNGNILINGTETNVYTHPNSGATAGTYKSVTVNAQGHVTGGTNPTTLAGYGITDAEPKGTVSTHNTSTSAHNDIRSLITDLTTKLNAFLDVDDTTTDQLSEVLTLIENNKGTLESLTSSKVNVSDIVNNLTTNVANKPLSAAQGVAIKALIDALDTAYDAHKHSASYTPAGTVSKPTFTGSAATSEGPSGTATVYSITAVGSLPSLTASVSNRCLTFTFGAGSLPTKGSGVSVATGTHTHSVTATGSVSQPTFTGTQATITTGTPA